MAIRIQKYLSERGILSRREAEKFMKEGLIAVNGKVVRELGTKVDPEKDRVEVIGAAATKLRSKMTVAVYKPRGILSSKNEKEGKTIFETLPQFKDLNSVGRLDGESEGLLLLSNDGVLTSVVTGADHLIEKEYEVKVREKIRPNMIVKMQEGIMLEDGPTLPAKVKATDSNSFSIILREGRKHQIRRMTSALRLTVTKLKRVRVGEITLKGLHPGGFRMLTADEIRELKSVKFH
jgi:pseudouridine synthase